MYQNQPSGILSDRQIRQLCETPVAIFSIEEQTGYGLHRFQQVSSSVNRDSVLRPGQRVTGMRMLNPEEIAAFRPMISPFSPTQVRTKEVEIPWAERSEVFVDGGKRTEKIISWGTSSYGYDVRCAEDFKIFTNINSTSIDPKNFDSLNFVEHKGEFCIIPPNSFVLARTVEEFCLPRNVVANCLGKSTYARCGISVMVTPLEPEWEGYLTLEFANTTPLPAKLYANEGCSQIQFFRGSEACEVSYKDRGGKYQNQIADAIPPRV